LANYSKPLIRASVSIAGMGALGVALFGFFIVC